MQSMVGILIGLFAGILGGVFGIGGGVVIVPALVLLLGFPQQKSQGTSLVALLAPVGLLAMLEFKKRGDVDFVVGVLIAFGFLLGAFLGSKVAVGLNEDIMRKLFAVFLAAVSVWMFTKRN
jgi:uncharacterized membrane protein YfcA